MRELKFLLFSIILVTSNSFATLTLIDKVSAIVNNDIILKSDIDNLMSLIKLNKYPINQQLPDDITLHRQILERLIIDQIILQIGQKMNLNISDEQLSQIINDIAKKNNTTVTQIKNHLTSNGINYTIYSNQIRKEALISVIRDNEVRHLVNILPQEIDSLINQINNQNNIANIEFNLSHIFISLPENPTKNQVIEAENQSHFIIKQINNDIDINKLSVTNPINQEILHCNHIGWKYINELPFIFTQSLSMAKKGDVIGPIRSRVGFHILKVNDIHYNNEYTPAIEIHARHILLKSSSMITDSQARKKLEQIAIDIKNGKITFTNAAKKFSQDFSSANNGGDLGWITKDSVYYSELYNILIHLNKGQLSAPMHSPSGWHLIEVLDIRYIDKIDIVQKNKIYHMLFNLKFLEKEVNWIQEQRANSYIKILDNK